MARLCLAAAMVGALAAAAVAGEAPATFKPDDEGFIRNWLVLGPIALGEKASTHDEASQKEFFDKEFWTGQKQAMPKAGDKVTVEGKELVWKAVAAEEYALDFVKICGDTPCENSLMLGVAYIIADGDLADLKLKIGSDDSSMWILNDKELKRVYDSRPVEKDQNTFEGVALKKGLNVLRMEVINGGADFAACARFTDKDDKPVVHIRIILTPPAK